MADNIKRFPLNDNPPEKKATENIFPDLKNEELVKAMNALKKEENRETQTALIEHVVGARFFAPVDVSDADGNLLTGNGKMDIPKDAKLSFKLLENAKGERYFAVFTDMNEFQKWNKAERVNTIVVVFPQIAQLAMEKSAEAAGFVINPMNQNIIFLQDAISNLLGAMKQFAQMEREKAEAAKKGEAAVQQQTEILFGKPQNVPEAVLGAFRKRLIKSPEVKEAYFCMMRQNEQEFYMFVLDIDADNDKAKGIGEDLCNAAKMFLTKYPIMAAPVDSPFGEGAKKVTEPFYVREGGKE